MNKILRFSCFLLVFSYAICSIAEEGKCGDKIKWEFDGMVLTISYVGTSFRGADMDDYDMKSNLAPWLKKGLGKKIRSISIGPNITRIGSCAFYNCTEARNVEFGADIASIGWGAFYGCKRLLNVYIPRQTTQIERIAFANCERLGAVEIPENCIVADYAFMSCPNITNIIVPRSSHLGEYAFVSELSIDGTKRYALYAGNIQSLPSYIDADNCKKYGLSSQSVQAYLNERKSRKSSAVDSDDETLAALPLGSSDVDTDIPYANEQRINTFALVIGNEDYTQLQSVPCALSDARTFKTYCENTLGIPSQNIMLAENATLNVMKRGLKWLDERAVVRSDAGENVHVIVYYAGHGIPDESSRDAYLLPVDGYSSDVSTGLSLQKFYSDLGSISADDITVFIDACFSGAQRNGDMITQGLRGVAVRPKEATLSGQMVVFSAAQGDETAQPYEEKGHGMFTYYLLKKLQESGGNVTYGKLSDYINKQVRETAISHGKSQTPSTSVSASMEKRWRNLKF